MTLQDALLRGLFAVGALAAGVVGLSVLEALWLLPARGVLSTFARVRAQLGLRSEGVDIVAAAAGLTAALLAPAVAAALLTSSLPSSTTLAAAALLWMTPAPVLLALGAGHDERARLALHDGLAACVRRGLTLLSLVVVAAPVGDGRAVFVVVAVAVAVVLVRGRQRGTATLQPRFEDRLAGPSLVAWRCADRAAVVVAVAFVGKGVGEVGVNGTGAVVLSVVAGVVSVAVARALGPLRGEGLLGPLLLLVVAGLSRVAATLLQELS